MSEGSRFICSTESNFGSRKVLLGICIAILIVANIWSWSNIEILNRVNSSFSVLLTISSLVLLSYCIWAIVNMISVSRSCLHVYEDHVAGTTLMGLTSGSVDFSLTYDQISQVETAKNQIILHTPFAKYTVMAMNNQYRASEAIRLRISSKN